MKFRILTTSQRRRERVFDIGFLMYFIGATLQSVSEAYLLQMGGSLALVWACLSWIFQKRSVPDNTVPEFAIHDSIPSRFGTSGSC